MRIVLDAHRADSAHAEPITLDMKFADEGGEGATPYEVLLHAAMVGPATRFTRQDGVEETWRIMQPLLDAPPPVHPYAPGSWGPQEADALVARPQQLARAVDGRDLSERCPLGVAHPSRSSRWSPTRSELAMIVSVGLTAPIEAKKLESTT